jgi:hypothetical protein
MCHPATCRRCGKITWRGCGLHVGEVRAMVPVNQWCAGHADSEPRGGLWRRLTGR